MSRVRILVGRLVRQLILLAVVSFVAAPVASRADNLLLNPSFDQSPPWIWWGRLASNMSIFSLSGSSYCYPGQNGDVAAAIGLNAFVATVGTISQSFELPPNNSYELSFLEWGQDDPVTVKVTIFDAENTPHLIDTFIAEQLLVHQSVQCIPGRTPKIKTYDITQFAGQEVVLELEASSPGLFSATAFFDHFKVEGQQGIKGTVKTRPDSGNAPSITIHLTGTTSASVPVDQTTQTGADGTYAFSVPAGVYTVEASGEALINDRGVLKRANGGVLSAETFGGGTCDGSANGNKCTLQLGANQTRFANFGYTFCAVPDLKPNEEPLTHCPVVLVPGFLGSRIACNSRELWPGLPLPGWGQLNLRSDGVTNDASFGECNASADVVLGESGILDSVAGADIYQSAMSFFQQESPHRWAPSPYDWRKSPVIGAEHLGLVVDSLLQSTGAKHVVLYGHSMGGLVIREYINNPDNRGKVARIVTAGTPYWGAPKSHFALLGGYVDTPAGTALDHLTWKTELQRMARNLQGIFFLYPSKAFKPWLSLAPSSGAVFEIQDTVGEDAWVQGLGGNHHLLDNARAWHDANDGFPATDIDYRIVVGAGTPTVLESKIRRIAGQEPSGTFVIGNGDGTVPLSSATQGASEDPNGYALGEHVPVYYRCGVGHVALPGEQTVLESIRDFLFRGDEIQNMDDKCEFNGTAVYFPELTLGGTNVDIGNRPLLVLTTPPTRSIQYGSETLTLDEASSRGLIQYVPTGLLSAVIMDDAKPVTLIMSGKNVAVQLQKLSSAGTGPLVSYKAVTGGLQITSRAEISGQGANLVAFTPSTRSPATKSKVKKKGSSATISLTVTSPNGVLGTYYRVGTAAPKIYKKAFNVSIKKPAKISFYSVDLYGQAEKWKTVNVKK